MSARLATAVIAATLVCSPSALAATSFTEPAPSGGGGGPMATADFDGDGQADVAAAGDAGSVHVSYGDGDGSLERTATFDTGVGAASAIVSADFNGDGSADLALTSGDSREVGVLLNDGTGQLELDETQTTSAEPAGIAVADFDEDGDADLAVAAWDDDAILVFPGDGSGAFGTPSAVAVTDGPAEVASADFDGDGRSDLAVTGVLSQELVLLDGAPGSALFAAPRRYGDDQYPAALEVGDVDGDSLPDAVALAFDEMIVVPGDAAAAPSARKLAIDDSAWELALADVNDDGAADALLTGLYFTESWLSISSVGRWGLTEHSYTSLDPELYELAAVELNGDHEPDLAVATDAGMQVMLGDAVTVSPDDWLFGPARQDTGTFWNPLTVTNTGVEDQTIGAALDDGGRFSIASDECTGLVLSPGESCEIELTFARDDLGEHEDALTVTSGAATGPDVVPLSGTVVPVPEVTVAPGAVQFDPVPSLTQGAVTRVVFKNEGEVYVGTGPLRLVGAAPFAFQVAFTNCFNGQIQPGDECHADVRFTPAAPGPASAVLRLESDAANAPDEVALSGVGLEPLAPPAPVLRFERDLLDLGSVAVGFRAKGELRLTNVGDLQAEQLELSLGPPTGTPFAIDRESCPRFLAPGATCGIWLEMKGGAAGEHAASLTATARGLAPVIARVRGRFTRPADEVGARALAAAAARWARSRRRPLLGTGFAMRIADLEVPGRLRLVIRGTGGGPMLARGTRAFAPGQAVTVRARLTRRGRTVLKPARRKRVVAELSFAVAGGPGWTVRRSLVLRR